MSDKTTRRKHKSIAISSFAKMYDQLTRHLTCWSKSVKQEDHKTLQARDATGRLLHDDDKVWLHDTSGLHPESIKLSTKSPSPKFIGPVQPGIYVTRKTIESNCVVTRTFDVTARSVVLDDRYMSAREKLARLKVN